MTKKYYPTSLKFSCWLLKKERNGGRNQEDNKQELKRDGLGIVLR
jgi:hypothetical protein